MGDYSLVSKPKLRIALFTEVQRNRELTRQVEQWKSAFGFDDAATAKAAAAEIVARADSLQAMLLAAEKLVGQWRDMAAVTKYEEGAFALRKCASHLRQALTAPPSSAPSDDRADTGREET